MHSSGFVGALLITEYWQNPMESVELQYSSSKSVLQAHIPQWLRTNQSHCISPPPPTNVAKGYR